MRELTYVQALRTALREEMQRDPNVFLMGEDIGDWGGTFKVTEGLIDEFPGRVLDTPLSESGTVGAAVGAALVGMRPVIEIMFMDFITCAMDPVVNQAAKLHFMSGGKAKVPLVIRAPEGGGVNAAAQHSQCLEAWFMHVPGLKVVMPSDAVDAYGLLKASVRDDNPVMFIEGKRLYSRKAALSDDEFVIPLGKAEVKRPGRDVTMVAISAAVPLALEAAGKLVGEGIEVEVIDPRTIAPLDRGTILNSVKKTGRLVVVHEAVVQGGVSAEISAMVTAEAFDYLDAPVLRVATPPTPIPFSQSLEPAVLPDVEKIVAAVRRVL